MDERGRRRHGNGDVSDIAATEIPKLNEYCFSLRSIFVAGMGISNPESVYRCFWI